MNLFEYGFPKALDFQAAVEEIEKHKGRTQEEFDKLKSDLLNMGDIPADEGMYQVLSANMVEAENLPTAFDVLVRNAAREAAIVSGTSVIERVIWAVLDAYNPLVTRRKPKKRSSRRLAVQAKRARFSLTVDGKIRTLKLSRKASYQVAMLMR